MPLNAGSRLGAFEIIGLIGAGGMGQVYRARDTRLDRDVAIKVLPESIVGDPDRLARFDGKTFTADSARPWSPVRYATGGPTRKYDLHPDGKRAIVASPDTTGTITYDKVVFVFNFFEELRRRLPAAK